MASLIPFNKRGTDIFNSSFDSFQNMLDDFFVDGWPFRRNLMGDTFKIDVQEENGQYIVEADLPGVQKGDVNLSLDDGRLTISVNKEENIEQKNKNYLHKERRYCSMSRSIYLADADSQGVKAKLENGVLTVNVPKTQKSDTSIKIDID